MSADANEAARGGASPASPASSSKPVSGGLAASATRAVAPETLALVGFLALVVALFGLASPRFLSAANFGSMAFQLPELGLLTLAMLAPILSGGLNLAIVYTANLSGLALAWTLLQFGGPTRARSPSRSAAASRSPWAPPPGS